MGIGFKNMELNPEKASRKVKRRCYGGGVVEGGGECTGRVQNVFIMSPLVIF